MNQAVDAEKGNDQSYLDIEITTEREVIVKKLNGICNQLLRWGLAHHPGDVQRCQFFRVAVYATSVQLQALRDKEIDDLKRDVEEIKRKLEGKT